MKALVTIEACRKARVGRNETAASGALQPWNACVHTACGELLAALCTDPAVQIVFAR